MANEIKKQMIYSWHVVFTKPRQEKRAALNLSQQGFEIFLPMMDKEVLRQNSIEKVEEPLFNRYLFVRFNEIFSPWHVIRNTYGVSQLVRFGGIAATIPDEVIEALRAIKLPTSEMFSRGDQLRICDGPFKDLEAIYLLKDGTERAFVLVELLNKIHKVSMQINLLKKTGQSH